MENNACIHRRKYVIDIIIDSPTESKRTFDLSFAEHAWYRGRVSINRPALKKGKRIEVRTSSASEATNLDRFVSVPGCQENDELSPAVNDLSMFHCRYLNSHWMALNPPSPSPASDPAETSTPSPLQFSIWQTFKRHIPHFLATIFIDIILPIVIYFGLQKQIKPVYALILAGTPPLGMVLFKAVLSRTFDALGFIVFIGFAISGLVAIITRSPMILLLEKSIDTGTVSIIFAITLIPFRCCHRRCRLRPLAYYFYQDLVPTDRSQVGLPEDFFHNPQYSQNEDDTLLPNYSNQTEISRVSEWIYLHCSSFRRSCFIITAIWAVGLLSEFLGRLTLILVHLSVNQIVLYGNIIFAIATVFCIGATILCIVRERRQTLAFIRQWRLEHNPVRGGDPWSRWIIGVNCDRIHLISLQLHLHCLWTNNASVRSNGCHLYWWIEC